MTRSPLYYPLNRQLDGEAGGLSDLQTDVMRFMAILALCLVAIFALVQSIPLAPRSETPATVVEPKVPAQAITPSVAPPEPESAPAAVPEPDIVLVRPEPQRAVPTETPPVLQHPRADSIVERDAPPITSEKEGFTLRFEDELALTRLVARNEVGMYAILPDKTYRMNVNRGQLSFWPASVPKRFHEMDEATVPNAVIDAFHRSSATRGRELKWGVTIPPATSRQVERYLREARSGDLIIDASGDLRLEH